MDGAPEKLDIYGDTVYCFRLKGNIEHGMFVQMMNVEALTPNAPYEPISPEGLDYEPTKTIYDENGIIYILSFANESIFRYSINDEQYLSTIPLSDLSFTFTYSKSKGELYLGYDSKRITKIPAEEPFTETEFYRTQTTLGAVEAVYDNVFVACYGESNGSVLYTLNDQGIILDNATRFYTSKSYTWGSAAGRVYSFRDGISPNDIYSREINEQGIMSAEMQSPYHGDYTMKYPIRISPAGDVVVLGSGAIFNAITLSDAIQLPNQILDAAWLNGNMYTLYAIDSAVQLQKWTIPGYHSQTIYQWNDAKGFALCGVENRIIAIVRQDNTPKFYSFYN